jgi:hypothetical protein
MGNARDVLSSKRFFRTVADIHEAQAVALAPGSLRRLELDGELPAFVDCEAGFDYHALSSPEDNVAAFENAVVRTDLDRITTFDELAGANVLAVEPVDRTTKSGGVGWPKAA